MSPLSRSKESIKSVSTEADKSKSRYIEELLAAIPLYLTWTAPPGDTRGADSLDKVVASPFETEADTSGQ